MKVRITGLLAVLLSVVFLATAASAQTGGKVAFVVGNSKYAHAGLLANPINDAREVATTLERLGFDVVRGIDLDHGQFLAATKSFARRLRGATVSLFFYAGHGLQSGGVNYLMPVDAKLTEEADIEFETVSLTSIIQQMEREKRTNIVILDACRDNPLARGLAARSAGGPARSATGNGLAKVEAGTGTLIAFATAPGQTALDGSGKNSPFTSALLGNIEKPGLDAEVMFRLVRENVIKTTNGGQVPWTNSSLVGEFQFVSSAKLAAAPSVPEPRKEDVGPNAIRDYLLKNPEILIDAQSALEKKMEAERSQKLRSTVVAHAGSIYRSATSPVGGNPRGDVTIVEFFDYNCGYCKRAMADVTRFVKTDGNIRFVYKELPILSADSGKASRVAIAAAAQGKYNEVHQAMLAAKGVVNEAKALEVARSLGLDMKRLQQDMASPEVDREIKAAADLAARLEIQGTPHFLVGDRMIAGAPENIYEVMAQQVAEIRKSGGCGKIC